MAYTTINKSSDHFNTKLYTGTGSSNALTGVGFQPDLVWLKGRSNATWHWWTDAIRGNTKNIFSNSSQAEGTNADGITSFNSDGFTLGTNTDVNGNGNTFASWNFKANGQGSSNTDGTINTTYTSANTTSGFSMIKYTGTGSNATVGHGLGIAPKFVIVKVLTHANDWMVGHVGLDATNPWHKYLYFNGTSTVEDANTFWNDTAPTNQVVHLGTHSYVNDPGRDYIMYAFAEVPGYSKIGSYVGNGNVNGSFVYTGFKPKFLLIKNYTTGAYSWTINDDVRTPFNPMDKWLYPNVNAVETSGSNYNMDLLSNGFKSRNTGSNTNDNNNGYIYYALGQSLVGTNNVPCTAR